MDSFEYASRQGAPKGRLSNETRKSAKEDTNDALATREVEMPLVDNEAGRRSSASSPRDVAFPPLRRNASVPLPDSVHDLGGAGEDNRVRDLGLCETQHVQNDFVHGLVIEQGLDGIVVDDNREQELGVFAEPVHVAIVVRAGRTVAAPADYRFQQLVHRLVWVAKSLERGLVHQEAQQFADALAQCLEEKDGALLMGTPTLAGVSNL